MYILYQMVIRQISQMDLPEVVGYVNVQGDIRTYHWSASIRTQTLRTAILDRMVIVKTFNTNMTPGENKDVLRHDAGMTMAVGEVRHMNGITVVIAANALEVAVREEETAVEVPLEETDAAIPTEAETKPHPGTTRIGLEKIGIHSVVAIEGPALTAHTSNDGDKETAREAAVEDRSYAYINDEYCLLSNS